MKQTFYQGDILRITGHNILFVVASNDTYIRASGCFHVCAMLPEGEAGPLHLPVVGQKGTAGTVACEQIKLIDPGGHHCRAVDSLATGDLLNVVYALQSIFDYI